MTEKNQYIKIVKNGVRYYIKHPNPRNSRADKIGDYRKENARKTNSKKHPEGYIYIINIEGTDLYKIGVSRNPTRRINDIESVMPYNILWIFEHKSNNIYELEKMAHEMFSDKFVRGEWFNLNVQDVIKLMATLKGVTENEIHDYLIKLEYAST